MRECLACRQEGRGNPATYIVTLYSAGGEQVEPSCDVHAMVHAAMAIAKRHGVWAMIASHREAAASPAPGPPASPTGAPPRSWLARLARFYRHVLHGDGP